MKKYDFTNKKIGKLTVIRQLSKEERPSQNHGNYWLCKCDCGNECKVPTSYLTGNGNYLQTSCGCDRKKRAFQETSILKLSDSFLERYNKEDFEKFLLLHKAFVKAKNVNSGYYREHQEEYKKLIEYFWHEEQFNKIYSFWKNHKKENSTFYDWAKPSLDHKIPISKGGKNELNNYQFLTTFENLAKRDMTDIEWKNFKTKTNTTSDYFVENILGEK